MVSEIDALMLRLVEVVIYSLACALDIEMIVLFLKCNHYYFLLGNRLLYYQVSIILVLLSKFSVTIFYRK